MKKYIYIILIIFCNSCYGKNYSNKDGEKKMLDFYNRYNIYKVYNDDENIKDRNKIEDKCITDYLSKEIKNKKTNYREYLLSLPVNNTDSYDKLIIDLTIKSAVILREDWDFMHNYLHDNIKNIDGIFRELNNYESEEIYLFFLVYFKMYEDPYPDLLNESRLEQQVKIITKYTNLKNELLLTAKRFDALNEWEMKVEQEGWSERIEGKRLSGKYNEMFSIRISHSLGIHGRVYDNKKFILLLEKNNPYYTPFEFIYEESIDDIFNTKFYTYGSNFFIIKKTGSEFILTKYEYNIKESKLKILDKVKLENCF